VRSRIEQNSLHPTSIHKKLNISCKFQGVWVMSDDEDASKTNLVNSQTPKWQASGVEWTKEGAKFSGSSSSKLTLENFPVTDWSPGLTWLLRLKGISNRQFFIHNYACTKSNFAGHLAEYPSARDLLWDSDKTHTNRQRFAAQTLLTDDPNEFMNIGITAVPVNNEYTMYYNGEFVTSVIHESVSSLGFAKDLDCFMVGQSGLNGGGKLTGTVRIIGIANYSMTLNEINSFFDSLV
jgi:hypothetical protein